MNTLITNIPGVNADVYALQYKHLFADSATAQAASPNAIIDGTKSRDAQATDIALLRPGLLMGRVTTGGKYAPSVLGLTGVLHDTSVVTTVMTLPAATVTEIARRIGASGTFKIIGPPTAAGTVATETVTYSAVASATTLTITATSADFAAGSIIAPTDGSETPRTFIPAGYGIPVTNASGTGVDQMLSPFYVAGNVDTAQIVNYSSMDASVKTWLKAQLRTYANFTFTDDR